MEVPQVNLVLMENLIPFHAKPVQSGIDTADGTGTRRLDLETVDKQETPVVLSIHYGHFRFGQIESNRQAGSFAFSLDVLVHKSLI